MTETPKETVPRPRSPGVEHALLWRKADSTWVWTLTAQPGGRTRLVTRLRARPDWRHPVTAITGTLLLELGDFAMMRRMLLGIRRRAECATGRARPSPARTDRKR